MSIELDPPYDLGGLVPGLAKSVVINDYLADGVMYITDREVILSKRGWEQLVWRLQLKNECNVAVRRIVGRKMADVITWLQEAGYDV